MTKDAHPTVERLLTAAIAATQGTSDPISDYADLRHRLGVSAGRFTNWKNQRGLPLAAALAACKRLGVSSKYVLEGVGPPVTVAPLPVVAPSHIEKAAEVARLAHELDEEALDALADTARSLHRVSKLRNREARLTAVPSAYADDEAGSDYRGGNVANRQGMTDEIADKRGRSAPDERHKDR